jgi:hypothetical protein
MRTSPIIRSEGFGIVRMMNTPYPSSATAPPSTVSKNRSCGVVDQSVEDAVFRNVKQPDVQPLTGFERVHVIEQNPRILSLSPTRTLLSPPKAV